MKQLEDYWPVGRWRTSTPEEQGMDSELLVQTCNFARQHGLHIHSLLIIRHGYAVVDAYFHPFLPGTMHDLASCTKSFTATLIGIAVDKGFIKSVKQPVLGFFPNNRVANLTDLKKELTLEHLLTMTSGMACYNEPGEITLREMFQSPDWRQFVLDLPMIEPSGTRFEYCSPGSHLLSAIVRETTGMSTLAFAREYLFGPLGIDAVWPEDPQGINHGWGDLHMTPHDMARLGYLYLHKGQWENRTIVSPQWVSAATKKHSSPPAGPSPIHGYGYQWWLFTPEIYYADGRGGQMIIVVPEADVVAVTTAGLSDDEKQRLDEMLISFIIPSIRSSTPLPVNPDGVAQLESGIRQPILYRDEPERPPVLPPAAQQITGQTYLLESNILGWREFSFIFNELEEALFLPAIGSESYEFRLGLDNVFRLNPEARFGLPAMLKGKWHQPDTFTVYWDEVANINRWQMDFTFEGDSVTIQAQESSWHGGVTVNGKLKK
ncbi:MAG TPA: serine hydrolase [Dehalococcoidia bacterium]|nr:serine hydrolase [Dehalococcoidia bacterium]